jgi:hypothetical protein
MKTLPLILTVFVSASAMAAPPWSPPVKLSRPTVNAESPSVAASDTGKMAGVWANQQGSSFTVQASVNLSGTWTRGVNLGSGFEPDIAIDNAGAVTAVWSTGNVIQASNLLPNGRWSPPVAVSDVGTLLRNPQVVADASGNVTAVWVRYDNNGSPGVEAANRPAGGNWSAPVLLASGAPDQLSLVANAAGHTAAIWSSLISTSGGVYASDRPVGGTWSTSTVALPAYRQGGSSIGIDANGNLTACWRTNTEIRVADKPASGSWGGAVTVYTDNAVSDYPVIAKTPSGDNMVALVTYVSNGGGYNYQIRTSVRPAGGSWSGVTLLTSADEYDTQLHARTTPGGSFVLTWVNDNRLALESTTRTTTTAWSPVAVITRGESGADLAVAGNTAVALWLGSSYQAMVATLPVSP